MSKIIVILLFACKGFLFAQVEKDTLDEKSIFAPLPNDALTAKESWDIHRTAFIKKLEKEGATAKEIKKRLVSYEKEKAEYIAQVIENLRLAEIKRHKGAELREKGAELREKGAEIRRRADAWRKNYELLITKNITLSEDKDKIEPISFELDSETTISFGVRAHISLGTVQLLLYNPDGKIEAELNLEYDPQNASKDGDMNFSSGSLDKIIAGAKAGRWQVIIIPENATGSIAFSVSLKKNQ